MVFVDDQPAAARNETYAAGSGEIVERRLRDGTRLRLVKLIRDPGELTRQLTNLGWNAGIRLSDPDWLICEARPAAVVTPPRPPQG